MCQPHPSHHFYPLEQMFALTPPRGVPLQRAEAAESHPTRNRRLFIYLLSKINSLPSPTAQSRQAKEHVAGVMEAQSPKPCWLNLLQNCSMDELLINTANKSVIPVCSESNRSHSWESSLHGIQSDTSGQAEGLFCKPALTFPSLLELFRLKIREHEVATGRGLKQSGALLTQLYTCLFPEWEKTLPSLQSRILLSLFQTAAEAPMTVLQTGPILKGPSQKPARCYDSYLSWALAVTWLRTAALRLKTLRPRLHPAQKFGPSLLSDSPLSPGKVSKRKEQLRRAIR